MWDPHLMVHSLLPSLAEMSFPQGIQYLERCAGCQGWAWTRGALHGAVPWNGGALRHVSYLQVCTAASVTQKGRCHSVRCPGGSTCAVIAVACCTHMPSNCLFNGLCCTIHILTQRLRSRSANLLIRAVAGTGCGGHCLAVISFLHPKRKIHLMTIFFSPLSFFAFRSSLGEETLSDTDGIYQRVSCSVSGVLLKS